MSLVDAPELDGHAQGDGLFDYFTGGRDGFAQAVDGVLLNLAGGVVLGLDNNGQAAGMLDEDVGAIARSISQHAGLLNSDSLPPARMLGAEQAGEFNVDGVFGGAGHASGASVGGRDSIRARRGGCQSSWLAVSGEWLGVGGEG